MRVYTKVRRSVRTFKVRMPAPLFSFTEEFAMPASLNQNTRLRSAFANVWIEERASFKRSKPADFEM